MEEELYELPERILAATLPFIDTAEEPDVLIVTSQ